ncbi:MAG: hypothetical protein HEP71_12495 [Roseivirga sp.]|nr:hypothetical protein [Roseivirga sp.]
MKPKSILLRTLCAVIFIFACLLSINSLNADDSKKLRRDTKKGTLGEDGLALCHCYTVGYKCYCVSPPPKGSVLGEVTIDN